MMTLLHMRRDDDSIGKKSHMLPEECPYFNHPLLSYQ